MFKKQKLVAESKIKKDKHESVIFRRDNSHYEKHGSEEVCIDDKLPFEIPRNWEWCYLGNGAILTGNSRPSNYFKNKPTSKDILIQIFHTKKGKVVAINFGKNGYMVTMIAGKEPTIVKDGNCLPSSEK